MIDGYVEANNLGTTNILRSFAPLLRDGGRMLVVASRAGSLRALAPALHPRFQNLNSLDDVDRAICLWRDAVRTGRAPGQAWPAWINIPSKIGQVAAVRVLATQRRVDDLQPRHPDRVALAGLDRHRRFARLARSYRCAAAG